MTRSDRAASRCRRTTILDYSNPNAVVSIVVATHNNSDIVGTCLEAIFNSSREFDAEVLVIDNASTDGTVQRIIGDGWPVTLIQLSDNVGFAKAINHGWAASYGRYMVLVNSDAFVDRDCINELVKALEQKPQAGIVGARLRYPSGRLQPAAGTFPSVLGGLWIALFLHRAPGLSRLGIGYFANERLYREPRRVDWVSAAVCAARREAGPLPTSSFMYGEDVEWAVSCSERGFEVWLEPKATAVHVLQASVAKSRDPGFAQRRRVDFELTWFARRGHIASLLARLVLLLHGLMRLLAHGALAATRLERTPHIAEYAALLRAALSPRRSS